VSKPEGATPDGAVGDAVGAAVGAVVGAAAVRPGGAVAVCAADGDADGDVPPLVHAVTIAAESTTAAGRHAIAATVGVSVGSVPATCDSCGAPEDHLFAVRRQYVTPAEWDTPAREVTLDEVEHWCFSCCTHYPHVEV
jgi:hypothetical protein